MNALNKVRIMGPGRYALSEHRPVTGKKPYQEPSLRVYGDIRILTQGTAMVGMIIDAKIPKKT
jgi:hypothetical protein